jgi:predicted small lipoprotein YifL
MLRRLRFSVVPALGLPGLLLVAACGQKGPLTLPPAPKSATPAAMPAAPAASAPVQR